MDRRLHWLPPPMIMPSKFQFLSNHVSNTCNQRQNLPSRAFLSLALSPEARVVTETADVSPKSFHVDSLFSYLWNTTSELLLESWTDCGKTLLNMARVLEEHLPDSEEGKEALVQQGDADTKDHHALMLPREPRLAYGVQWMTNG
ncbi:hypothetical protein Ancab_031434 [Ancistrocladus abbreviatus]